jgi:fatty-acyl-CoA synthase
MGRWNIAEVWEAVADARPDAPALVHGPIHRRWSELDRRADAVAAALLAAGLRRQDKVAQYLYNCPEFLESSFAIFKAALVPVNTNYRYGDDELVHLWEHADVSAVIFPAALTDRVVALRARVPAVRCWLRVGDDGPSAPSWVTSYDDVAARVGARVMPPSGRTPDDLYLLYTGGTTGLPKGVMWRQDDLFRYLNRAARVSYPDDGSPADVGRLLSGGSGTPGVVHLSACPLVHGTGSLTAFQALGAGGSSVTLTARRFDPIELLDTVERERVQTVALVGDTFAAPIADALDAEPDRWDISSLESITSSGVTFTAATKRRLLAHHPTLLLVDALSSSEALGIARSVSGPDGIVATNHFVLSDDAVVIDDDGRPVAPGSGTIGRVAVRGITPVGYYKDPEASARILTTIDGERYSVPGDFATIEADGTMCLLGRGSVCINTGGEKVFAEEVEETLKTHPGVRDAVVVGVPDARYGHAVVAVVQPDWEAPPDADELIRHVKARLAGYKAPRHVLFVDEVPRANNAKVDYRTLAEYAAAHLAPERA